MVPGNPFDDDGADPDETIRVVRAAAPEPGKTGHAAPSVSLPPVHPTGRPTIPTPSVGPTPQPSEPVGGAGGSSPLSPAITAIMGAASINPLLDAATPLLALVARMRDAIGVVDAESLRERVIGEIRRFETTALTRGLPPEAIRFARYALCATIDDIVLNTGWGSQSVWLSKSLVSTIHKETWGGERFFELLDAMQADPSHHLDELEVMYVCLALGFEGKYRVQPRGINELNRLRDQLYRVIRRERGEYKRDLSPQWKGLTARHAPLGAVVPLWVIGAVGAVLLLVLFTSLRFALSDAADIVYARLLDLFPSQVVTIVRVEPPPPLPAAAQPTAAVSEPPRLDRLRAFLQAEIDADQIEVEAKGSQLVIRTVVPGLFASASAALNERYLPLLDRIAEALGEEKGAVTVMGYTDNVPIRNLRFPSNLQLSLARAQAVEQRLAQRLGTDARLSAEGRGEADPITSNSTPAGRERNRRIEIVMTPAGAG